MAGFSLGTFRMLHTARKVSCSAIVLMTLSACTGGSDAALDPPRPTNAPSSAVSASGGQPAVSSASTAAASETATASPGLVASATPRATAPTPTVIEQTPGALPPSATEDPQQPAPTGTVVTVPAQTPAPSAQTALNNAPACELGSAAVISAQVSGTAAAGSQYITLTFTNTGATPCSIVGYPAVSYVDAGGHTIGAPAARAAEWTSTGVLLTPGESAQATLRETRASLFADSCQALSSSGYRVQLPQTSGTLTVPYPAEACSNTAVQQMSVGQVGATP
ncbi:DUF4232 domain-containing protein [Rothia sp. ZJ1223]|uniref:DUF4232 domain-containing protein n=1 Tax=Rothia sp. ZJ1223 TaxID=2811098 RepID=UPI001957BB79|nr:DUF4232 domain-containing protein [Rothia sp. ZJ1223]MBM7052207.1 DUF4232 domain-containing protein [Rothia sp. ZJ1223]